MDLINVDTIKTDLTILNIIKTIDQVGDRRFTCTCCTNKSYLLSRFCIDLDIMQNDLLIIISKINIIKYNITFQLAISCCSIILMIMFPSPQSGLFLALLDLTILLGHIHELHITFIHLRLLVKQLKDTICTRQCHNDRIDLLTDLIDRLTERFIKR